MFSWPGTEGLDAGVVGYRIAEGPSIGYYGTDEDFPTSGSPKYEWIGGHPVDPYNTFIEKWKDFGWPKSWNENTLRVERQTPVRDELVAGRQIEYWVPVTVDGEEKWKKVVGTVVPWVFTVQLSIVPGTNDENPAFENGERLWFGLGTKKWDRAYAAPNSLYDDWAGYSIPLCVYIEEWNPYGKWPNDDDTGDKAPGAEWVAECVQISPDMSGRTVTLFSDPTNPVSLDDAWYKGNMDYAAIVQALNTLNSSMNFNPNPDQEFANHAYFSFTFSTFRPKEEDNWLGQHVATWFPSVSYRLKVYYLELGEFVYAQTQEDLPWWDPRGWAKTFTPIQDFWNTFFATLGVLNPFAVFGAWGPFVAFLFTLGVIGIIVIVLLAVFAPGALARLIKGLGRAGRTAHGEYRKFKREKGSKKG